MDIVVKVDVAADPADVWRAVIDVDDWPRWTKSITSVEHLDEGPLRVGSRVRIKQLKMPALVWQVTELTEGRSFTWVSRSPGVATTGVHEVTAEPEGASLRLTAGQSGPLAGVVSLLTSARTRRYVEMEAAGLKARSEQSSKTEP